MSAAIGVFTKAPIAGETKTRLVPAVGEQGAAALHRAFLEDVLRTATKVAPVTLFVTAEHPALLDASERFEIPCLPQCPGDLGARMADAIGRLLQSADVAVLLGSDSPTLPDAFIRRATDAASWSGAELAFGPSADGGFYTVAARRVPQFQGVRWSHSRTLHEALAQNPGAALLSPWYDVDTPEDLAILRTHLLVDPDAAPSTSKALGMRTTLREQAPPTYNRGR